MVNRERFEAVQADPKRVLRVKEMIQSLGRVGSIAITSEEELNDLRAVMYFHPSFSGIEYAITPDEVFIWGHNGNPVFSSNWNRFREAALKFARPGGIGSCAK